MQILWYILRCGLNVHIWDGAEDDSQRFVGL